MATSDLKSRFKNASVITKMIIINVVLFIVFKILVLAPGSTITSFERLFLLPYDFSDFLQQPWSIITYSFFHGSIWHVGVNMFMLYVIGEFVLNLFSSRRFLTVYFLGAMSGGLVFLLGYDLLPFNMRPWPLGGASGAVMAIMVFIAAYAPYTEVRIVKWNIKLWHIAAFFVVFDLFRLVTGQNSGGMLAHLGGAAFGYIYAKQLAKGNDIGKWFEKLLDGVANLFKSRKSKPFKKVHRNKTTQSKSGRSKEKVSKSEHQVKVDAILDKIGKGGYESLTKAEKDFLFKAGKND
ncbi:MAG: rhomboid family intramembrane serine protease [Flavobacteriaceae bacterium]|nr:rhomboid family intramembrane serine protease [Flavobacteriaceae bacterium]